FGRVAGPHLAHRRHHRNAEGLLPPGRPLPGRRPRRRPGIRVHPRRGAAGLPRSVGHAAGLIGRTIVSLLHGVPYVEVANFADAEAVLDAISRYRVTWANAIAVTWARMLRIYEADTGRYDVSALTGAYAPMLSVV